MRFLPCWRALFLTGALLTMFFIQVAVAQRFAAIGDYGYAGVPERDVAELVKSWNPEFIITLGDNNYEQGLASTIDTNIGQYYHQFIAPYRGSYGPGAAVNQFFPSLGNHDTYTKNGEAYLRYFSLPGNGRYYDFVRGQVHFFVLNSTPDEPDGTSSVSTQAKWLKARLAASKSIWKVVYFHHPPYSSGVHGSTPNMRWPFRAWGASLVVSGHDHHYERLQAGGLVYCVNGLSGRSIYGLTEPLKESQVLYNADYGAMLFDATSESLRFRFYTRARQLIDSYTLWQPAPQLFPLYPTPFSKKAHLKLTLPSEEAVKIRLLDAVGHQIAVLYEGRLRAGQHELHWSRGQLAAGTYFVQLLSGRFQPIVRALVL
ncbi:metallophosphoesterase family protein [Hymenobacter sp. BT491]|uniref:metallophosphoesterase family protein n=1 Tax=Hymenobacter sp. BT491 TaxID=2766779 RepID=UPI001653711D|nr:metallophosphoesterase [Hymenobacter sp. BT491]MBC6988861.1 metallophosphoesterase [Hymenobacter sp. BT491]